MDDFDETWQKAANCLNDVTKSLDSKNRFFARSEFDKYLKQIFTERTVEIKPGHTFFRARQFRRENIDKSKLGTQFEGFDAENSFVNFKNRPREGRMSPQGIYVLYVASNAQTAITELNPGYDEIYSIATIENTEQLRIADLSQNWSGSNDSFTSDLSLLIQEKITKGNGGSDYIFPQYVAALCQSLGYDGIGYRSRYFSRKNARQNCGVNYTIFNYEKCRVTGSKLKGISSVNVKIYDCK